MPHEHELCPTAGYPPTARRPPHLDRSHCPTLTFGMSDRITHFLSDQPSGSVNELDLHREVGGKSLLKTVGMMMLQGLSCEEIALTLNEPSSLIRQYANTPYVQDLFRKQVQARGKFVLSQILQATAIDSVLTLMHLRDNPTTPAGVRKQCAEALLDRALGKPKQQVRLEGGDAISDDPKEALEAVNSEIQRMEEKLRTGK